ncbi:MAG TPA: hypothetical protein VGR78_10340 [Verrucomicrobiae bacterium]|jgi:hypothetical protein|nr:hypothetical protein [Verrucomicrobiae bacterium]
MPEICEQVEFPALKFTAPAEAATTYSEIIDELRNRLRRAQAAQFRAEAQLAIVTEERNKLAARLHELAGNLYKMWRAADGPNAGNRR